MVFSQPKKVSECSPTPISPLLCRRIQGCTVSKHPRPTRLKPPLLGIAFTPGRFILAANIKSLLDQAGIRSQRDVPLSATPVWLIIT